jgi:hypothetical protein
MLLNLIVNAIIFGIFYTLIFLLVFKTKMFKINFLPILFFTSIMYVVITLLLRRYVRF